MSIEILLKILSPLDLRVIYNFCITNKTLTKVFNERFWRHIIYDKIKLPGILIPGTWTNLIKKLNVNVSHFKLYIDDIKANREHKMILEEIIKTSNIDDFFFNGYIDETVWKEIAKEKLGIIKLGKFNSWEELNKIMMYKPHDIYTVWNKYKFGFLTKIEAERSIVVSNGRDKYGRLSSKNKYKTVLYKNYNINLYCGAENIYIRLYGMHCDEKSDCWNDISGFVYSELSEEGIQYNLSKTSDSLLIKNIYVDNYNDLLNGYF